MAVIGCAHRSETLTIPFHAWGGYLPLVAVEVAGTPRSFILDTGADGELLDVAIAQSLGLPIRGATATAEPGGSVEEGATRATLAVGGLTLRDWRMITAPIAPLAKYIGQTIDGLLGHSFLRGHIVAIDWMAETIVLYPVDWQPPPAAVLPLEITDTEAYVHVGIETAAGVVDARVELDTGSFEALGLTSSFVDAHHLAPADQPRVRQLGVGFGGTLEAYRTRLAAVRIGEFRIARPMMAVTPSKAPATAPAGVIGAELLRRFTVILDYPHSRMMLIPNRLLNEPIDIDRTGLFLIADDPQHRHFVVVDVVDDSPAAAAGIHKGDAILAVDGRPARDWTLEQLFRRGRGSDGELTAELRRPDGTAYTVKLRLARLL